MTEKAADAYRTISEAAEDLDLPQHVLRFWETRFGQIRPLKRSGGRRYYRPDDVELLRGIKHLLHGERYTIKGVQKIIRERGPRFVGQIGRDPSLIGSLGAPSDTVEVAPRIAEPAVPAAAGAAPGLSLKDRERLQSALFELMECRRVLAAAVSPA